MTSSPSDAEIVKAVQDAYGAKALTAKLGDGDHPAKVAASVGYTPAELLAIPNEANLGLSCGNPVGAATLKEGETVLDLGSGAGMDVFLAASKVGESGKVVGIDGSLEMINRARHAAREKNIKPPQISFVHAQLTEPLPIADGSVDCVLSNCVVNLLPAQEKRGLFGEVRRVLREGGRIVLDDVVVKRPLDAGIKNSLTSYVNCIAGAIQLEEYQTLLRDAGFTGMGALSILSRQLHRSRLPVIGRLQIILADPNSADAVFVDTKNDLDVYYTSTTSSCCSTKGPIATPPGPVPALSVAPGFDANEWVASYQIFASKPTQGADAVIEEKKPLPLLRWWDAYPTVQSSPALMSQEELAAHVRGASDIRDFVAVDVRRDDYTGGRVKGSANWPAQSFYDDLPAILEKYRNTKKVVFYCGSSSGRGPRCAGWYQDYLNETGTSTSQAYILQGGVKAWLAKYAGDDKLVDQVTE